MKRLGVSLLPPGWDTSPSHGYPPPPPFLNKERIAKSPPLVGTLVPPRVPPPPPPHFINKERIANLLTVQAWPAQLASVSGFSSSLAQMFQGL